MLGVGDTWGTTTGGRRSRGRDAARRLDGICKEKILERVCCGSRLCVCVWSTVFCSVCRAREGWSEIRRLQNGNRVKLKNWYRTIRALAVNFGAFAVMRFEHIKDGAAKRQLLFFYFPPCCV